MQRRRRDDEQTVCVQGDPGAYGWHAGEASKEILQLRTSIKDRWPVFPFRARLPGNAAGFEHIRRRVTRLKEGETVGRRKNRTNRAAAALGISPNGWCNGKGRKRLREKKWGPTGGNRKSPVQKDINSLSPLL